MENYNPAALLNEVGDEPVDLRVFFYSILDRLWLVVLITVLASAAGLVYVSRSPRIFAARTVLMVEEQASKVVKVVNEDGMSGENMRSAELLNTLVQSIQSREVMQRVVQALKLTDDAQFLEGTDLAHASPEQAMGMVSGDVKVEIRKNTRLVDIVAEHRVPETAAKIADAVAQEFLRNRFAQNSAFAGVANDFLRTEAERLKDKLQKSEEALHQYTVDHSAYALDANQNTIVEQLKDFNTRMTQAKSERLRLEGDAARAKELAGKPDELLTLSSISTSPTIFTLTGTIAKKESDINVLSLDYKSKHPKYIAAATELENLHKQLNEAILKAADLLSSQLRTAQETEAGLVKAEAEQQNKASELNQKAIEYNALTREMESNRAMYQSILTNLKETDVTKQWNQTPIRVVEPAYSYGPIRPKKPLIISATAMGGFMLGLAIAFGLSLMDTSIKTVDDAEKLLRLPALAAVPRRKFSNNSNNSNNSRRVPLPAIDDPKGSVTEAFRSLRANLSLLGRQEDRRAFLFTSAHPAEGKSFTCCNFAIVSAQMGVRTLLIDADLRRPSIAHIFYGEAKKPGLTDCLSGQVSLQSAAIASQVPNLSILPAGSTAPNPAELLSSGEFAALMKEALLLYDRVIVDTAPVNAVSDTLLIAPHVQTICMVIRAGSTHGKSVLRAAKSLTDIQCRPAGLVLNYLPEHRGIGYYYYYYSGEYGSAGVYGSKTS